MTKHYDVIHTETETRIGFINLRRFGWYFISNVSNHKGSRVARDTATEAFPGWAKRMGCEMVARD